MKIASTKKTEQAYRVANAIVRAKRECENAQSMSVDEATQFINQL